MTNHLTMHHYKRPDAPRSSAKPHTEQLSLSGKPSFCPVVNDKGVAAFFAEFLDNVVDVSFDGAGL
jgi:hypothetical protein